MSEEYLLDTHALLYWYTRNQNEASEAFFEFFDQQNQIGSLKVSTICFLEIALLIKKGKIQIGDPYQWQSRLLEKTKLEVLSPSPKELMDSVFLPEYHKDPFDRTLIAQSIQHSLILVTKDSEIKKYALSTFWI